jgi:hypothetical protein
LPFARRRWCVYLYSDYAKTARKTETCHIIQALIGSTAEAKKKGKRMRKLLLVNIAVFGMALSLTDVSAAERGGGGMGPGGSAGPASGPTFSSEGNKKGFASDDLPRGWDEGKKKGWGCKPGTRGCEPPGLTR